MDKIMVGDIIKIDPNNVGHNYPLYSEWFGFYGVSEEGFDPGPGFHSLRDHIDVYDEDYVVRWIAPHLRSGEMLYAIKGIDTSRVFLVEREAIAGYYHTENSADCCHDFNERLLVREVVRLNSKIDVLREEVISLKEKLKEKEKEEKDNTNVETNPMPRLKNGMFGVTRYQDPTQKESKDYMYNYFIVIEEQNERFRLIYENGEYDIVGKDFDCGSGIGFNFAGVNDDMTGEIICLMVAVSFKEAKNYMSNEEHLFFKPRVIWEKYPKGC